MREIVHVQAGQCGNQIGAKVSFFVASSMELYVFVWAAHPTLHFCLLASAAASCAQRRVTFFFLLLFASLLTKWPSFASFFVVLGGDLG